MLDDSLCRQSDALEGDVDADPIESWIQLGKVNERASFVATDLDSEWASSLS